MGLMTLPAEHSLEVAVARNWPPSDWRDCHVLLAVSGGPDSVAMLRAMLALKERHGGSGRIFVGHLHHGLRGAVADADRAWIETLCRRWEIPLEVGYADVPAIAADQGDGCEAAARKARYEFLAATAEKLGARMVAVAHTADDQVETVLHRILRGTGIAGLAGMPRRRPLTPSVVLERPLLDMRRRDVLRYLSAIGQNYRTDESNADVRWTRNFLRNELLPTIRAHINTEVDEAVWRLAAQAEEVQQFVANAAARLASQAMAMDTRASRLELRIDGRPLSDQPPLIVGEVFKLAWAEAGWPLQAMGFREWRQLAEMVRPGRPQPPLNLPGNILARRDGEFVVLESGKQQPKHDDVC